MTCRLHGVNPYTYLVDVLQRIGQHPASRAIELTPRLWETKFARNPLRSSRSIDLDKMTLKEWVALNQRIVEHLNRTGVSGDEGLQPRGAREL